MRDTERQREGAEESGVCVCVCVCVCGLHTRASALGLRFLVGLRSGGGGGGMVVFLCLHHTGRAGGQAGGRAHGGVNDSAFNSICCGTMVYLCICVWGTLRWMREPVRVCGTLIELALTPHRGQGNTGTTHHQLFAKPAQATTASLPCPSLLTVHPARTDQR